MWRGTLPELSGGERHWILWKHLTAGGWRVELDGRVVHPSETMDDEQAVTRFDRVSVWIGPSVGGPTSVNGIALQYDRDGDDVYAPYDNCPHVFNPDQVDVDGNGRGLACDDRDGDGVENNDDLCVLVPNPEQRDQDEDGTGDACAAEHGVAIGTTFDGLMVPWTFDLASGLYQPVELPVMAGDAEFAASRDGWWAWTRAGAIYVQDPEADEPSMVADGQRPSFMGETLVFVSPAGDAVMKMPRDQSAPAAVLYGLPEGHPEGSMLTARVAPSEAEVVVLLHAGDDDISLVELDGEGQALGEPIPIPAAGDGALPMVERHPSEALYLVSATGGLARGVTLIDADGNSRNIALAPTFTAAFTPSGDGVISLSPGGEGTVVTVRDLDPDGHPPTVVLGPSQFIDPVTLIPAPHAQSALDSDHDGRPDAVDHCADVPPFRRIEHRPLAGIFGDINFYRLEDSFAVSWTHADIRGVRQLGFARLSAQGDILASHAFPEDRSAAGAHNLPGSDRRHAYPVWMGDRYDLFYYQQHMHPDYDGNPFWRGGMKPVIEWAVRDLFRASLSPDWTLGPAQSLFEGTDEAGQPGRDAGIKPLEWVNQLFPWGYRLSAIDDQNQSFGAGERRFFDISTDGRILDRETIGPPLPNDCVHGLPLRRGGRTYTTNEMILVQCARTNQLDIYRLNSGGAVMSTSVVGLGPIRDIVRHYPPSLGTHDVALGANGGMTVYVADDGPVHGRGIDDNAVLASAQRIVSGSVEGAWSVAVGAGDDRYGVVFTTARSAHGGAALYFVAVDRHANALGEPLQLAPPGSARGEQDLQVEWDGEAWVVLWRDMNSRIQFARGRFDCR